MARAATRRDGRNGNLFLHGRAKTCALEKQLSASTAAVVVIHVDDGTRKHRVADDRRIAVASYDDWKVFLESLLRPLGGRGDIRENRGGDLWARMAGDAIILLALDASAELFRVDLSTDEAEWHGRGFGQVNAPSAEDGPESCPPPAVPLYATVSFTNGELSSGTVATYTCDPGYELFGSATRSCSDKGRWVGGLPYCAVNVAYGKPTNQSSTVRGGDSKNANDGDLTTLHENRFCTETKLENAPWWQVDLLRPYQVRVVRVLTRGCCEDGSTKDFECAYPILGRYVYIHMVGGEGSLSLCEVMVFTTQG
ncbi:hypothetical protein MRX96_039869 [Rhipicephalus microplus]